jgi:YD repeat-containing protein
MLAAVAALPLPGCRRPTSAPAADREDAACADVETLRVCWDAAGPRLVKRPVPAAPATPLSPMGWRCVGSGAARRCTSRADGTPVFACTGSRCEQRHPRMPDDGEWQCTDSAGATVCVGGARPAGVAPAPADAGWTCGARRGGDPGTRVCVDLSPDFPDGHAHGWRCRTMYDGPARRICDRDPNAHTLADACNQARPCVDGSRCTDGRCLPERPAPACWLDDECPGGRCRFGSCLGGGA